MLNIAFRQPSDYSDIRALRDFLYHQNLGYPSYDEWVFRATEEIDDGYKQSILAFDDGKIVGNVIFQPHKEISNLREIKNLRVDQSIRLRKFGSFLLRQAEWFQSDQYEHLIARLPQRPKGSRKTPIGRGLYLRGKQMSL